jgi:hypothetical protein
MQMDRDSGLPAMPIPRRRLGWRTRRLAQQFGCSRATARRYVAAGGWQPFAGVRRGGKLDGVDPPHPDQCWLGLGWHRGDAFGSAAGPAPGNEPSSARRPLEACASPSARLDARSAVRSLNSISRSDATRAASKARSSLARAMARCERAGLAPLERSCAHGDHAPALLEHPTRRHASPETARTPHLAAGRRNSDGSSVNGACLATRCITADSTPALAHGVILQAKVARTRRNC